MKLKFIMIISIFIFCKINIINTLTAFSCSDEKANYTSFSLVDLPDCDLNLNQVTSKEMTIQLVQKKTFRQITYQQCSIITKNQLFRCGRLNDSPVQNGLFTEIIKLSREECNQMLKYQTFDFNNKIYKLDKSERSFISDITHGSIKDGSCTPGPAIKRYNIDYDRPVIQTEFEILKIERLATVDLDEDKIIFEDGTKSKYSNFETYSSEKGYLFWREPFNLTKCNGNTEFTVIYEGLATKIKDSNLLTNVTVNSYIIQMQDYDIQIGLMNKKIVLCGLPAEVTEHPKLNIIEKRGNQPFLLQKEKTIYTKELNPITYINSKLVHLMKHTGEQINSLYKKFSKERCLTENRITQNLLTLALISPIDFAYEYTRTPGFTAIVRGEIVYLISCQPVDVELDTSNLMDCYNELPVVFNGKNLFIHPRSRVLISLGTKIDCVHEAPAKYKINGQWFALLGSNIKPQSDTIAPKIITREISTWNYKPIRGFMNSGIYSPEDLDKLEKFLMSPIEKEVVKDSFARVLEGRETFEQNFDSSKIFQESLTNDIILKMKGKLDEWYYWQARIGGTFGFIMLCLCTIKIIKMFANSLLNFKILYETFGFGWKLLSCIWTNLTHILLNKNNVNNHDNIKNEVNELKNIKVNYDSENEGAF